MLVHSSHHLGLPALPCSSLHTASKRVRRPLVSMASPIDSGGKKWLEFPHLSTAHRSLMLDLVSMVERRLGSQLQPSSLPPDVSFFQNQQGNSQCALHIRSGKQGSPIDLFSGSWIHCELPSGVIDITTIFSFLNDVTDAPHLLLEFIQGTPTSVILFMDLIPRKDLVLHPDYLTHFYEETQLDAHRKELEISPYIKSYLSSSLYIRSLLSPTAISVSINSEVQGKSSSMEEIMGGKVGVVVKEVLGVWLDCACSRGREVREIERSDLVRRDGLIKNKAVELDLRSNLPRLFGPDVAERALRAIEKVFAISSPD